MAHAKHKLERMTQKAYAKLIGVTPQYVNKLVKQGKIRVGADRLLDRVQADKAIEVFRRAGRVVMPKRRVDKAAHRGTKKPPSVPRLRGGETLTGWRMQSEKYKAQKLQLEYEATVGNLLPRDQVLAAERLKNEHIRLAFRALPRSIAPLLSRCASAAEAEAVLREAIDRALDQLAGDVLGLNEGDLAVPATTELPAAAVQTSAVEAHA